MKATLYIFLALAIMASQGCVKCATCTVRVEKDALGVQPETTTYQVDKCGDDLRELDGANIVTYQTIDGIDYTIHTSYSCE